MDSLDGERQTRCIVTVVDTRGRKKDGRTRKIKSIKNIINDFITNIFERKSNREETKRTPKKTIVLTHPASS